jgi:hypothetical protein
MPAFGVQRKWRKAKDEDLQLASHGKTTKRLGARVLAGQPWVPCVLVRGPYNDPWNRTSTDGKVAPVYDVQWIEAVVPDPKQATAAMWKVSESVFVVDDAVSADNWKKVAAASMQPSTASERQHYNVRGQRIVKSNLAVFLGTEAEWVQQAQLRDSGVKKRQSTPQDVKKDQDVFQPARRAPRGRGPVAGRSARALADAGRPQRASTRGNALR